MVYPSPNHLTPYLEVISSRDITSTRQLREKFRQEYIAPPISLDCYPGQSYRDQFRPPSQQNQPDDFTNHVRYDHAFTNNAAFSGVPDGTLFGISFAVEETQTFVKYSERGPVFWEGVGELAVRDSLGDITYRSKHLSKWLLHEAITTETPA